MSIVEPESASEAENGSSSSSLDGYDGTETPNLASIRPIARWRQYDLSGQRLLRECGGLSRTGGQVQPECGNGESHDLLG